MTGFAQLYEHIAIVDGVRTPFADYNGAYAAISPTDLGIKVAREAIRRSGLDAAQIDAVFAGNMAPGDFYQYMLPRHIGLYAGVPETVPALMVQRICGTGFELFRQAADALTLGTASHALIVGTESMTRNPIASFTHRGGFKLGAPVEFKDFLWEALGDPAVGNISMIQTAENLARRYGITRTAVDGFAAESFARAVAAQVAGFFDDELIPVSNETIEHAPYAPRKIRLAGKANAIAKDEHPRLSPIEVLAALRPVYSEGVQTAGNSAALVDGAGAAVLTRSHARAQPLAWLRAAAVVGVDPAYMGIGPAPAIRLLLARAGLTLDDIGMFEINEAQGAQCLSVMKELGLDPSRVNVHGGAIAMGHPLAATGVRLTLTCARALRARGKRYGVAAACIGGGQGIALLLEVTQ
jgi:acetyl-CoA C-acetyltransferase